MRVVELVTPVTEPQEDDVALVMRDSSPAMVSIGYCLMAGWQYIKG